jgi:multidrug efflux pump subunit AcrA (membrane-fusion protein)
MQKRVIMGGLCLIVAAAVLLVGCGGVAGFGEPAPTEEVPIVTQDEDNVIVEAVIEPARWSQLCFAAGGKAVEVRVEEGDAVAEGDLLVRFDATDAERRVREAEVALTLAEAQLAQANAGPRPEEVAVAETALEVARAAISQTLAQRDELLAGAAQVEIAAAQAAVAAAQAEQVRADILHDETMKCFNIPGSSGGKEKICPALGPLEEQARSALNAAGEGLTAAETQLKAARGGAWAQLRDAEAALESATARQDVAQAQLELVRAGSRPEDIAAAEARVAQAEASLAAARGALDDLELRAPFDGVVAELDVGIGDTAAPGAVVVVVATLDQLRARITDLTELDVARVAEGQETLVTVDALPDVQLAGRLVRIEEQSVSSQGDVTYPVIVELDQDVPGLRWGMTAMVEIETD